MADGTPPAAACRPSAPVALGVRFAIGMDWHQRQHQLGCIARLNGQAVVVTRARDEVYGTGLHMRFGGGYALEPDLEIRGTFTLQSLDADLVRMGDIGASSLYGQYDDYQSFGLDAGLRQYGSFTTWPNVRPYGEGTIGLAFVDETDIVLVAPAYNFGGRATDFYDKTAAADPAPTRCSSDHQPDQRTSDKWACAGSAACRRWTALPAPASRRSTTKGGRWTFPIIGARLGTSGHRGPGRGPHLFPWRHSAVYCPPPWNHRHLDTS
jgi:hypothetical protein